MSMNLSEAPGARASFHLGLWALITGATVVLAPVGIALAIAAIVQGSKAHRLSLAYPDQFLAPGGAGKVMGIVALCLVPVMVFFLGIVSAIAIPALLAQRGRARDKAAVANLTDALGTLAVRAEGPVKAEEVQRFLAQRPERNPWDPNVPAHHATLTVTQGLDEAGLRAQAELQARVKGQATYLLQVPDGRGGSGYLAGAVRLSQPVNGSTCVVRVLTLE